MRLLPLLTVVALFAGCSQNPHVDVASPAPAKSSANAVATATPQTAPVPSPITPAPAPDRDGDGVPDVIDQCPDKAGPAENNGCPYEEWQDFDHDGVPDADDDCPAVPGPAENKGCPWPENDRDHDFVPDDEDECPDVPGQVYNRGCPIEAPKPIADRDGDGVPDGIDKCPDVPGAIYNDGCPLKGKDSDHDGIVDGKDWCPLVPGPVANHGCPYPKEEERRVLREVKESLKFDFDKATIKPSSFPALDKLVGFLKKYPESNIRMVGHTDEVGTDEYNLGLSEARVLAVKAYLTERGIRDYRITTGFRGERDPLVSTKGLSGEALERAQAKNRRVDMSVKYETIERR